MSSFPSVTQLETQAMLNIAHSYFTAQNGDVCDTADETSIWLDAVADGGGKSPPYQDMDPKQTRALVVTLQAKGLVAMTGRGRDAGIQLTELGFALYKTWL